MKTRSIEGLLASLSLALLVVGLYLFFVREYYLSSLAILLMAGFSRVISVYLRYQEKDLAIQKSRLSALRIVAWSLLFTGSIIILAWSDDATPFIGSILIVGSLFVFQEIYVSKNWINRYHR